jgi:hypothetical protein
MASQFSWVAESLLWSELCCSVTALTPVGSSLLMLLLKQEEEKRKLKSRIGMQNRTETGTATDSTANTLHAAMDHHIMHAGTVD